MKNRKEKILKVSYQCLGLGNTTLISGMYSTENCTTYYTKHHRKRNWNNSPSIIHS